MPAAPIRLVFAAICALALGFADSDGCGYVPDDLKGEGEPCTRSSECQTGLECRGGVCMTEADPDAGAPGDAGVDAGPAGDAGPPDEDAGPPDEDAGPIDDAGPPLDAGPNDDGGPADAAT